LLTVGRRVYQPASTEIAEFDQQLDLIHRTVRLRRIGKSVAIVIHRPVP